MVNWYLFSDGDLNKSMVESKGRLSMCEVNAYAYITTALYRVSQKKDSLFNEALRKNKIFDFQSWNYFQLTMSQLRF